MPDIKHVTLVAATPQTVTLDGTIYIRKIEVLNRGTVEAFARQDGVNPAVDGEDSICIPANSAVVLDHDGGTAEVRLISSGTPKISVWGRAG
jgi:hypothetical protein